MMRFVSEMLVALATVGLVFGNVLQQPAVAACKRIAYYGAYNPSCSCKSSVGACPSIYKINNYPHCVDVLSGENGRQGCITATTDVGDIIRCTTNANIAAVLVYAVSWVACAATCIAVPASGGTILVACLACIAIASATPAVSSCIFVTCARGSKIADVFRGAATGLTGNVCSISPAV